MTNQKNEVDPIDKGPITEEELSPSVMTCPNCGVECPIGSYECPECPWEFAMG